MIEARCGCGALRVQVEGEREAVVACSCDDCRRRSGSAFGMGVYYPRAALSFVGEPGAYTRPTDSGNTFTTFFCPTCGTSLYWHGSRDPSRVGIAVGCFEPAEQFAPDRSVYDVNKQRWVDFGDIPGFERGRDSTRTR
ncbi:hypothetical protein ATE48_01775 [Candidatus Viadribacter manganicus]|uniref:CENP-V/GFA domain-containing protein n=2 Tax=Candidatus Viadribacter manganicus TaxID=1759059 RepID=A0A1B1ADU9_9PROT|nr:GFA family protein [Candidatus Viadribacter manganicus]ANP44739.1 hypothetical protein ATE48_01775 [Candidatus Viadribacter manganicus]